MAECIVNDTNKAESEMSQWWQQLFLALQVIIDSVIITHLIFNIKLSSVQLSFVLGNSCQVQGFTFNNKMFPLLLARRKMMLLDIKLLHSRLNYLASLRTCVVHQKQYLMFCINRTMIYEDASTRKYPTWLFIKLRLFTSLHSNHVWHASSSHFLWWQMFHWWFSTECTLLSTYWRVSCLDLI